MPDIRDFVREKLAERGLSMKEASERIGRNHAYLQQFLERGVPASLPEEARERLAELFGISPEQLRSPGPSRQTSSRPPLLRFSPANPADKIPVMGVAEGGEEGKSLWNGEVVDHVARPPSLAGATNAYATYVTGTSMEPRYHPGEMIYVHPGKPVTVGSYVLVQLKAKHEGEPPPALIKRLAKKTGAKIVLEQFNPPKHFDIALKEVVSMHRIVGSGE
jgi:phage repressor protein C with HTH and peptisase S24 domain